jgi:hypothetical protein
MSKGKQKKDTSKEIIRDLNRQIKAEKDPKKKKSLLSTKKKLELWDKAMNGDSEALIEVGEQRGLYKKEEQDSTIKTEATRQNTGLSKKPETALNKIDTPEFGSTPLKVWKNEFVVDPNKPDSGAISQIMGTKDTEIAQQILTTICVAINPIIAKRTGEDNYSECFNLIFQSMHDFQPKDATEARLIAQAIAVFQHGMDGLAKAANATQVSHRDSYINTSTKLFRVHNETIEALNRHRRGGEQRVIVQHQQVNITGQAQAVVGNFHSEGGGAAIKNRGDTPCQQYAEPKQEQTTTSPVGNTPCQTADAGCTVESVPGQRQRKAGKSSKT